MPAFASPPSPTHPLTHLVLSVSGEVQRVYGSVHQQCVGDVCGSRVVHAQGIRVDGLHRAVGGG